MSYRSVFTWFPENENLIPSPLYALIIYLNLPNDLFVCAIAFLERPSQTPDEEWYQSN